MSRFAGLSGVRTNMGGLYFLKGDYEIALDEVKLIKSRKGADTFIVSGTVLKSTNPDRAPGCKPSQVITIKDDILETCMANIKAFAAAALDIADPDSYQEEMKPGETQAAANDRFWEQSLDFLVSDEQPLRGTKIRLNVTEITTRAGKPFSKHVWTSMPAA
jgi:hypothetical protein